MSPYHGTASLTEQALWKFGSGGYLPRGKQQCTSVLVEAVDPSTMASTLLSNIYTVKMAPISLSNTWKEFHNLYMLWMCIWMSPFCSTASLAEQAFGSCLEFWVWVPSEGLTTAYCCSHPRWLPLHCQTHMRCFTAFMLWMCTWMSHHNVTASIVGKAYGFV